MEDSVTITEELTVKQIIEKYGHILTKYDIEALFMHEVLNNLKMEDSIEVKDFADIISNFTPEQIRVEIKRLEDYYLDILIQVRPYIQDFEKVLEGEGAGNYYSSTKHRVVDIKELQSVTNLIANTTYGHRRK